MRLTLAPNTVLLVFVLCFSFISAKVHLNSTTNGYSGIVVAVQKTSHVTGRDEAQLIIENIKELLTNASHRLHDATGQAFFFDQVTILLPHSYHNVVETDGLATGSVVYNLADIRITSSSESGGLAPPSTVRRGDCGEPGDFVRISSEYILRLNNASIVERSGDPGKLLLALWGQYRYGLFDEADLGRFYYNPDEDRYVASYCSNTVANGSSLSSVTKLECAVDEFGLPMEECVFIANRDRNDDIKSSLLFDSTLPYVTEFCNASTHNRFAQTLHNRRCSGRSAWEVMKRHSDFQNLSLSFDRHFSAPRFRILTSRPHDRVVFVIDLNIVTDKPIADAVLASLSKHILYVVPTGTTVEIAFMNETSHTISVSNRIKQSEDRHKIVDILNNVFYNDSLGLTVDEDPSKGEAKNWNRGAVFFVTTALNVTGDWSRLDGAHFLPIFLNTTPNEQLIRIADESDGKVYAFWGDEFGLEADLDAAFFDCSHFGNSNQITRITSRIFRSTKDLVETFFVDREVCDSIRLVVSMLNDSGSVEDISIVSPSSVYSDKNIAESDTLTRKLLSFNLTDVEPGLWSFRLRRDSNESESRPVLFTVFYVAPKSAPTKAVIASLDVKAVESNQLGNLVVPRLTVTIDKSDTLTHSANVTATVLPPGSYQEVTKVLRDDGIGADVIEGDGVFSTFLTNIVSSGVYGVRVSVYGGDYLSCLVGQHDDCFQRSPSPLYFTVKHYLNGTDVMPPSAVTDLSLLSVRFLSSYETVVTLKWSAPGDDYDDGIASEYELRYFDDWSNARDFSGGKNVTSEMLVYGSLWPRPSGSEQIVSVKFLNQSQNSVFIAIRAYDEARNVANASNVVGVRVSQREIAPPTMSQVTTDATAPVSAVTPISSTSPAKVTTATGHTTSVPSSTVSIPMANGNSTEATSTSDEPPSHAYDGVIASVVLLSIALVVTAAFCIHMRFFSQRARERRSFAYEEFDVGERIASRIER